MFKWLTVSMTRKISTLSFILLSFLFAVIVYSAYQSQRIYNEIHEVAKIDVPLTEVMADIEILQLKQHLLMESIRQQGGDFFAKPILHAKSIKSFDEFSVELAAQLDKSAQVLQIELGHGSVRMRKLDHKSVLQKIMQLHQERELFDRLSDDFLARDKAGFADAWPVLEKQYQMLDVLSDSLLNTIDQLTVDVAMMVEKQERQFVIINALLGLSAFAIGTYLTLYIITTFRKRIWSLRGHIEMLRRSMPTVQPNDSLERYSIDELDELETDLKALVSQFSSEMNSRDKLESQLMELATRDKLTGVFNRHKWEDQIRDELALANRGHYFGLIFLDVDHFKSINDTYGHDVGDQVLKLLVNTLRKRLRETDVLFRLGGEEFAILLRNSRLSEAQSLAEQLRQKVENLIDSQHPAFTISLGVTEYQSQDDLASITKRADVLLYEAKAAGRNCVVAG